MESTEMENSFGNGESTNPPLRTCSLCGREVDEELFNYHRDTEQHLIDRITEHYPAWKENPSKALQFYRVFILTNSK
ncbi:hypothetical protein HOF92_04090 [bacterium]|jgi:hypothetical protein|nr:hypothetical protein [bacterium]